MSTKKLFIIMVILAFASVISFFHVNSWVADKHGLNGLFKILGIVFGLAAAYFLYRVAKQGGTPPKRQGDY